MSVTAQSKLRTYANDPAVYRADLIVDANGRPVRFGDVMEPWQDSDFRAGDPGWRQAIGLDPKGEPKRLWLERGRGHSKTTDIAAMALWAVLFSMHRIFGIIASGKLDQAKIVASAVQTILDHNPYMRAEVRDRDTGRKASMIECQSNRIRNCRTGSVIEILPSDGGTSFGHLADLVIVDEIANWPDAGEAFWIALASTLVKRPRAMGVSITNAGFKQKWQYKIREAVRTDPRWITSILDGPQASWMTAALLAEQEKLLPPGAFRRLCLNEWQDGSGDALPPETVRSNVTLAAPGMRTPEGDGVAIIGVDLATRRDSSAFTVLEADHRRRRVRVLHSESWRPPVGGTIDLIAFRDRVAKFADEYCAVICYDPHQAVLMAQQWMADGFKCHEVNFTPTALSEMASVALQAFREFRIDLYEGDDEMISDLLKLSIQERNYGFRIVAPRDGRGHCDKATSLLIALPGAWLVANEYTPDDYGEIRIGGTICDGAYL